MAANLLIFAALCFFFSGLVMLLWGILAIREGQQHRPWVRFIQAWEFLLGMTLVSVAAVPWFATVWIFSSVDWNEDISSSWRTMGITAIGINLFIWSALGGACWITRRFSAEPGGSHVARD